MSRAAWLAARKAEARAIIRNAAMCAARPSLAALAWKVLRR